MCRPECVAGAVPFLQPQPPQVLWEAECEVELAKDIFASEGRDDTNQKKNRPKPSYDIHYTKLKSNYIFPVNEHFDKLSPFKIYDEKKKKEEQTYIKFSSSTEDGKNFYSTLNNAYEGLSENTFIKKLSEILFLDKTKKTARMNINVVRPSRDLTDVETTLGEVLPELGGFLFDRPGMGTATKDMLKKNVIDSTLFSTLQGFCEIRDSDI